jgi:hypothetical protein
LTVPLRSIKHHGPILYDDIVKPAFRTGVAEALESKIYRVE